MYKIYVDGQHGTTGLLVNERLANHPEVEILEIPYEKRHDRELRKNLLNEADLVFLCLPDEAVEDTVGLVTNPNTKIIDASTANRINDSWAYGLPELSAAHREKVAGASRVSNPGCHATASIVALYPLVEEGIISKETAVPLFSITGYTGGGKKMIETYETTELQAYKAPRQYALGLTHKHVPEIMVQSGLKVNPILMPVVSNFPRGLAVTLPLSVKDLEISVTKQALYELYRKYYGDSIFIRVHVVDETEDLVDNAFDVQGSNDTNYLDLYIYGNEEQIQVISRLDNLGKGASGAAIQNMNIMLGMDETTGLL
ncbi:N-acetyl-gamma-glutamyl-phosphate reductase [Methanolobus zinderi]|jgi:N-acetyl-gamma-glutamyl-phosphate reductase|uniref:N-acetyl-gamma-glutamyl-phosphate reductase n=1 Tax=Methanolobus zinderi TaxID=536044 RepID=A0A7D5I3W6_9EURY|nr:N-acetyl-gamma-glutamyl-phosphate reductase [Methanolobus zinderi]QLC49264.1 N-acetyl-gamma-glutamyl-phosphate reductase [Methanolobus zinderi]